MMEMSMDMAMGDEEIQEEMMGMWDDADWGADYKDISVAAGSFDDALHLWFAMNQDEGSVKMDIYSHQDVPLVMLVKMAGKVKDTASGGLVDMDFELIEYGDDAEGWITGEPEMFSFEMMGGMMGGM
jgi:hypothetical protein